MPVGARNAKGRPESSAPKHAPCSPLISCNTYRIQSTAGHFYAHDFLHRQFDERVDEVDFEDAMADVAIKARRRIVRTINVSFSQNSATLFSCGSQRHKP